jgi:thiosulfate reductase cytochrome b subunit
METSSDPAAADGTVASRDVSVQPTRAVACRHHVLVRWTHWLTVPLLLGLILSGVSIYSVGPVYQHSPDAITGNTDYVADVGIWLCTHVPGLHHYKDPPTWVYDHFGWPSTFPAALRLHWLLVYLFMLNGTVYMLGLVLGGGYRSLLPRLSDIRDGSALALRYVGVIFAKVTRRTRPHPHETTKYNPLQRLSYSAMPVAGLLAILSGWAMHKPMQLHWLAAMFGGYDDARIWHFWLTWVFILFTIPHVILILLDGWDTTSSMIFGLSERTGRGPDER